MRTDRTVAPRTSAAALLAAVLALAVLAPTVLGGCARGASGAHWVGTSEPTGTAAGVAGVATGADPAGAEPSGAATPSGGTQPSTGAGPSPSAGRSAGPAGAPPAAGTTPGGTTSGGLPPVVNSGPRRGNRVALTFDADMTDAMLANLAAGRVTSYANVAIIDLLQRQRVPATFFLTGKWIEHYPDLTHRLAGDPSFELANHSYGHQGFTPRCYQLSPLPAEQMAEDVAKTFNIMRQYGGRQTDYFRFPGLCHDAVALHGIAALGVTVVDGDVVSGDPFATAYQPIVHAVLSQVRPGSIVIMHVTEANAQFTDEALPHILDGLRARGLRPVTLSEVLAG